MDTQSENKELEEGAEVQTFTKKFKKKVEGEEEEEPEKLVRPGTISKKLILSTVAGGGFILVLVIVVSITKQVGRKGSDQFLENQMCPDDSTVCPEEWVRAFHKCYYLSMNQKSWKNSQKICRSFDAVLARFTSPYEMEFLMKRIGSDYYWFGLTNEKGGPSWTWTDGTAVPEWLQIEGAGCAYLFHDGIRSDSCESKRKYMCHREDSCA